MENKENNKKKLVWSDEMDEVLLKEVILYEPYQFKCRTKESGNAWKAISESLSRFHPVFINIDSRACREWFTLLKTRRENELKLEEKASGISPDETEKNRALDEIIERVKEFEKTVETKTDTAIADRKIGEHIRLQAMETFCETKKRKEDDMEKRKAQDHRAKKKAYIR